jgi:hypothetical protein
MNLLRSSIGQVSFHGIPHGVTHPPGLYNDLAAPPVCPLFGRGIFATSKYPGIVGGTIARGAVISTPFFCNLERRVWHTTYPQVSQQLAISGA